MNQRAPGRRAMRGLLTRIGAMLAGTALALALIIAMQLPLLHRPAVFTSSHTMGALSSPAPALTWPTIGSGALYIPAIGITRSWRDHVVPIASLTKMMTAFVTLRDLPLSPGATGPCTTVSPADVATFRQENTTDQSNAPVVVGEQLCEFQLLDGLLVHSAGNYAEILARLVAGSATGFVDQMNATAQRLGLSSTHYADVSGYSPQSVSTALDQARLAALLMRSPVVRSIVIQRDVTLPVAGTLNSFTPLVGVGNVIGVKSGRTQAAGGCDAMAVTFRQDGLTRIVYAVILGQRGGDMLTPAGAAALALANSALALRDEIVIPEGTVVGNIGWRGYTTAVRVERTIEVTRWRGLSPVTVHWRIRRFSGAILAGERVGWLTLRGVSLARVPLVAQHRASPPNIWQRLR